MTIFKAIHVGAVGQYTLSEEAQRLLLAGAPIEVEFKLSRPVPVLVGEPFEDDRDRLLDEARD